MRKLIILILSFSILLTGCSVSEMSDQEIAEYSVKLIKSIKDGDTETADKIFKELLKKEIAMSDLEMIISQAKDNKVWNELNEIIKQQSSEKHSGLIRSILE